jgi:hypothetical protein
VVLAPPWSCGAEGIVSSSILQAIWPGEKHENVREYRNSWGTAPIVWGEFCKRYLGCDENWWLLKPDTPERQKLWDLWKSLAIPVQHRAVFLWTFDHFYVKKVDYRRFAADLRKFLEDTLISANRVNHWPLIAQVFEMDMDYPALALYGTTVNGDPWDGPYDEEKDEYGQFDWSKASDLYVELDAEGAATPVRHETKDDPLCELGVKHSEHTHPHECNVPAVQRETNRTEGS